MIAAPLHLEEIRSFNMKWRQNFAVLTARIFVVVTLALGTTSSPAQTPPAIVGQPQNQLVIAGSNAVFSVAATGDNPGYQWYFNDTNSIVGAMGPTLILTNVQTIRRAIIPCPFPTPVGR